MPLGSLNQEQLEAAKAPFGHNLIIASAGTGKTSTIVGRIAHLLQNGTPPSKILLLTFTNKAAGEMLSRLRRFFPDEMVDSIESGTFHAVSYRWLKQIYPHIVLKQPGELKTLFRSIFEQRNFARLNHKVSAFSPGFLYEQYSLYQNATLGEFGEWFVQKYEDHKPYIDAYCDIIDEYEEQKSQYGFVSFNDLLIKVRKHLDNERFAFEEVLVDEYQDTNTLQGALVDEITKRSLFCVGDYDQSIYAFNGANIENIASFASRYEGANVYTLKTNYRSSAGILSLANRVIEKNERIYPKSLEVGKRGEDIPPKLLVYEDLFEQYQSIAAQIYHTSASYDDIAVIFRNNSSADGIEASLRENGIACRRKGGVSFFESREIRYLLDTISLLVNPKDMMAFIALFEYASGVGSTLAKDIFLSLRQIGSGNLIRGITDPQEEYEPPKRKNSSVQLALFEDDETIGAASRFNHLGLGINFKHHPILKHPKITTGGVEHLVRLNDYLVAARDKRNAFEVLHTLIESDFYRYGVEMLSNQRAKLKNGEIDLERKKNAKEKILKKALLLLKLARNYNDLPRFVNAMILGGGELSEGEGVNLLTVHASKGLEFEEVYVVDLVDGRFPNRKMMSSIEEERRLFYVAVTRAKERLYLSLATYDRYKKQTYIPSPFLYEAKLLVAKEED